MQRTRNTAPLIFSLGRKIKKMKIKIYSYIINSFYVLFGLLFTFVVPRFKAIYIDIHETLDKLPLYTQFITKLHPIFWLIIFVVVGLFKPLTYMV